MNIKISRMTLTKLLAGGHLTLDAVTDISKESKKIWHHALLESLSYDKPPNSANKPYSPIDH